MPIIINKAHAIIVASRYIIIRDDFDSETNRKKHSSANHFPLTRVHLPPSFVGKQGEDDL